MKAGCDGVALPTAAINTVTEQEADRLDHVAIDHNPPERLRASWTGSQGKEETN